MRSKQRGAMMVFAAGIILFLSAFAVMAIDVGRIHITRGELQNAADAASLAGANCMVLRTGASAPKYASTCGTASGTAPLQWSLASSKATGHLGQNKSEGVAIASSGNTVEVGYWNIVSKSATGGSFSTAPLSLSADDYPAVRVLVKRDQSVSNGPLALISRMFSGMTSNVALRAEAVAIIAPPSGATPGNVIPVVINKCMFDLFWDSSQNQPRIYTGPGSIPADPFGLSKPGEPYTIRIGSAYHYGNCEAGQWTSFDVDTSSGSYVKDLVDTGNLNPLSINQQVYVKPGTEASVYKPLGDAYTGEDVNVLVVNSQNGDLTNPTGPVTIAAFAGFRIDAVVGGSGKYIEGHFIKSNVIPGGTGLGGTYFGTYATPTLAR